MQLKNLLRSPVRLANVSYVALAVKIILFFFFLENIT